MTKINIAICLGCLALTLFTGDWVAAAMAWVAVLAWLDCLRAERRVEHLLGLLDLLQGMSRDLLKTLEETREQRNNEGEEWKG